MLYWRQREGRYVCDISQGFDSGVTRTLPYDIDGCTFAVARLSHSRMESRKMIQHDASARKILRLLTLFLRSELWTRMLRVGVLMSCRDSRVACSIYVV